MPDQVGHDLLPPRIFLLADEAKSVTIQGDNKTRRARKIFGLDSPTLPKTAIMPQTTATMTRQQSDMRAAVRALASSARVKPEPARKAKKAQAANTPAFTLLRMNGIGNKILLLDLRHAPQDIRFGSSHAVAIAQDLHEPYDQLMLLQPAQTLPVQHSPAQAVIPVCRMTIYNQDGSISGACGNGTRCVVRYLVESAGLKAPVSMQLESDVGVLDCTFHSFEQISVNMGRPNLEAASIPLEPNFAARHTDTRLIAWPLGTELVPHNIAPPAQDFSAVNMGNPHAIFLVDDITRYDLENFGSKLETCALFPERANITLAKILSRDTVALKVWERGAGLTLACGSAACAAVVALARRGLLNRMATVKLPGGALIIEWQRDDCVIMSGAASFERLIALPDDFYEKYKV